MGNTGSQTISHSHKHAQKEYTVNVFIKSILIKFRHILWKCIPHNCNAKFNCKIKANCSDTLTDSAPAASFDQETKVFIQHFSICSLDPTMK